MIKIMLMSNSDVMAIHANAVDATANADDADDLRKMSYLKWLAMIDDHNDVYLMYVIK